MFAFGLTLTLYFESILSFFCQGFQELDFSFNYFHSFPFSILLFPTKHEITQNYKNKENFELPLNKRLFNVISWTHVFWFFIVLKKGETWVSFFSPTSNFCLLNFSKRICFDNACCLTFICDYFKLSPFRFWCCIFFHRSTITSSSDTCSFSLPLSTSISILPVCRKGLLRIKGTSLHSSISMTTRSTGNVNLSVLTSTLPLVILNI